MPSTTSTHRTARAGTIRRFIELLASIRLDEVIVLQGTPLLGALFAMGTMTTAKCIQFVIFAIASCCLVAHVFLLNDWAGAGTDLRDSHRAPEVFTTRGVSSRAVASLCVMMLVLTLLLLTPFGATPVTLALVVALLSALYSAPRFAMKGVPLASSVLHLLGGVTHFLLGYSVFHPLNAHAIGIGSFFALTFAAGHLTHESRDCANDMLNGIRTNAVRFGVKKNFTAGFALFTLANIMLFTLATVGAVPHILMLVAATYPLHLHWTLDTWEAGLRYESIRRLQLRYRMLYALIGLAMALASRFAD